MHGALEFVVPNVIPAHQAGVMVLRAIQGAACGIIYALIGPMCQKHTFHFYLSATVGMTIAFFRLGQATPMLLSGEFCRFGNYTYDFYIVGGFTIFVSFLWVIVMKFDTERRRAIDHLLDKEEESGMLKSPECRG